MAMHGMDVSVGGWVIMGGSYGMEFSGLGNAPHGEGRADEMKVTKSMKRAGTGPLMGRVE